MGEVSKNMVAALAILVIIVSAIGTWTVMEAAMGVIGGVRVPVSSGQDVLKGTVSVYVNGTPTEQPVQPVRQSQTTLTGMVSVYVK